MIKFYLTAFIVSISLGTLKAQRVGVNTENPTRTLDINGDLRIRTLETTELHSFLAPDTDGTVKKLAFKGTNVFTGNLKNDLVGGDIGAENENGKFSDNRWKKLPLLGNATDYISVAQDSNFLYVKKTGFYTVSATVTIDLDNESNAYSFDKLTYAKANGLISIHIPNENVDSKFDTFDLAENSVLILKGANIVKARYEDTSPNKDTYNTNGLKRYNLILLGSGYFTAGTFISFSIHTFGMPGIVTNDKYSNFKFNSSMTKIKVYKNL